MTDALSTSIDRFAAAIGEERVLVSQDDINEFSDPFTYKGWDEYKASAVVMPTSAEEVQAIVRIANETVPPPWPLTGPRSSVHPE